MKNQFILCLALVGLFACNSQQKQRSTETQVDTQAITKPESEASQVAASGEGENCYVYIAAKDTVSLQVKTQGQDVTGNLIFNLFEKDKNTGSLKGTMQGDTLIADYTFNSEGSESVRQVVFLKKEDTFIEGFGEMEEKDKKLVFKNRTKLNFDNGIRLMKQPCK